MRKPLRTSCLGIIVIYLINSRNVGVCPLKIKKNNSLFAAHNQANKSITNTIPTVIRTIFNIFNIIYPFNYDILKGILGKRT
jgi:hypothetical protein